MDITLRLATKDDIEVIFDIRTSVKENHLSKPVLMIDKGKVLKEYSSINSAKKDGFNDSLIVRCCKGVRKKHKGYEWKYKG